MTLQTQDLLEQKSLFKQYSQETEGALSALSFVQLFAWRDFYDFEFRVIDGNLCVFASDKVGVFCFLPPMGKNISRRAIKDCFEIMEETNRGNGVSRIENVSWQQLEFFPETEFAHYRKGHEYCYLRKDLDELKGNEYKSKRSDYNQFISNHEFRYGPYQDHLFEGCCQLYEEWAQQKQHEDDISRHMIEENRDVHRRALSHCKDLGLTGRVVIVDGKVRAYTFGYPVSQTTFCVFLEIADLNLKGLPVFIFREYCRDEKLRPYKFINVMDDSGIQALARVKLSFRPTVLWPVYVITQKKEHAGI